MKFTRENHSFQNRLIRLRRLGKSLMHRLSCNMLYSARTNNKHVINAAFDMTSMLPVEKKISRVLLEIGVVLKNHTLFDRAMSETRVL